MTILLNQCSNHSFCSLSSELIFAQQSVWSWQVQHHVVPDGGCFLEREREKTILTKLTVSFGWTKCSSSADNAASCLNLNKTLLLALHSPRIRWLAEMDSKRMCKNSDIVPAILLPSKVPVLIIDSTHHPHCKSQIVETQCSYSRILSVLVQWRHHT